MAQSTTVLTLLAVLLSFISLSSSLKKDECEVCVKTLDRFGATLTETDRKDFKVVETRFREYCLDAKGKENRFCYYLGGLAESATGILGEISKPLSYQMPSDKICEKLKKQDAQICELRFDKTIDLKTVELKKLKVRDLKKILSGWDEDCDGCIEKSDYIKRIEELKPKYMRNEL